MQDSQTSTLRGCAGLMAWRGIELQGSQIFCEGGNGVHAIGKGIELQGSQTTPPSEANKAMFWKRKNCRVLKLVLLPIYSFWRRKSYMVLKPGGWTTGLEEDKIAGFSNNASIRSKQSNALEAKELQGTQTIDLRR